MGITTQSTHNFEAARTFKSAIPTPSASVPPYRPLSRSMTPFQMAQLQFDFVAHGLPTSSTTAVASFLGTLNSKMENRPPGEFNHAIQYLNKIKARYADDPDVYKQFLEILQTYQREQRQLQDVSHLTACRIATHLHCSVASLYASASVVQGCSRSTRRVQRLLTRGDHRSCWHQQYGRYPTPHRDRLISHPFARIRIRGRHHRHLSRRQKRDERPQKRMLHPYPQRGPPWAGYAVFPSSLYTLTYH